MSIPLAAGLAFLAAFLIEALILPFLMEMLFNSGAIGRNYLGQDIVVSAGLSFPFTIIIVFIFFNLLHIFTPDYQIFLVGLVSISLLGFIDDRLGRRDTLGFRGHLGALFKGKLTTGGLKAVGGFAVAFYLASFQSKDILDIGLNTVIIALFTNMLNLLDLRPGRAVKGYIFFLVLIAALAQGRLEWLLITPLLGAVLCYFNRDLKARAMMGDAGSNVLGLALGYYAMGLPVWTRVFILIFLIGIHLYTEKYSLTETIERVAVLRYLDRLGRGNMAVPGKEQAGD